MNEQTRGAEGVDGSADSLPSASASAPSTSAAPSLSRPNLRSLDLRALPRDDGPPSETQLRRQKYLYFEKHCSEVSPGLFLSGDYVAKNREILRQAGVTHVLNCVGFICKEYFKEELTYRTLYLQDTPAEDIGCVLYDSLDYIDSALGAGGRVLVHCSQGVSRSATLAIAYIMWRTKQSYEEAFGAVKGIRGVANPNIGFTCQLLQWQKRAATARARMRVYRIAPHCPHAPAYLVPKLVTPPKAYPHCTHRDLDPRGAFVLQTPGGPTYVWRGARCPEPFAAAAHRAAEQLRKFEGAGLVVETRQGHEASHLASLLDPPPLDPEAARINAKRSSITGEIVLLPGAGPSGSCAEQAAQGPGLAAEQAGPVDMEVELETESAAASPSTAGGAAGAGGEGGGPGAAAGEQPGAGGSGVGPPNTRWAPQEVDEYTDDYALYWRHATQQASASGCGSSPFDCPLGGAGMMRASYDVAGCAGAGTGGPGPVPAGCEGAAARLHAHLLAGAGVGVGPGGRPDSPATKEGRHKKYRRADSELSKASTAYWTAACSDGIGPELARSRHVASLHESVDEEVLGLP